MNPIDPNYKCNVVTKIVAGTMILTSFVALTILSIHCQSVTLAFVQYPVMSSLSSGLMLSSLIFLAVKSVKENQQKKVRIKKAIVAKFLPKKPPSAQNPTHAVSQLPSEIKFLIMSYSGQVKERLHLINEFGLSIPSWPLIGQWHKDYFQLSEEDIRKGWEGLMHFTSYVGKTFFKTKIPQNQTFEFWVNQCPNLSVNTKYTIICNLAYAFYKEDKKNYYKKNPTLYLAIMFLFENEKTDEVPDISLNTRVPTSDTEFNNAKLMCLFEQMKKAPIRSLRLLFSHFPRFAFALSVHHRISFPHYILAARPQTLGLLYEKKIISRQDCLFHICAMGWLGYFNESSLSLSMTTQLSSDRNRTFLHYAVLGAAMQKHYKLPIHNRLPFPDRWVYAPDAVDLMEARNTPWDVYFRSQILQGDYVKMVAYLLDKGADPNKQDTSQRTPLQIANDHRLEEIVKLMNQPKKPASGL